MHALDTAQQLPPCSATVPPWDVTGLPFQQQSHGVTSPDPTRPSSAHHWCKARQAGYSSYLRTAPLCPSQAPTRPGAQGALTAQAQTSLFCTLDAFSLLLSEEHPRGTSWLLRTCWFSSSPPPAWPQRTAPLLPQALL